MRSLLVGAVAASVLGCEEPPPPGPRCTPANAPYSAKTFWGAGIGALMETGIRNDWTVYAELEGMEPIGLANDLENHMDADLDLAQATGMNMIRMQLDWSLLMPTPGEWNADAVAYYHRKLDAVRARGLEPHVVLHWYMNPLWVIDPNDPTFERSLGGWLNPETVDAFVDFAARAAAEFGGEIDWWLTIHEPLTFLMATYLFGQFPSREPNAVDLGLFPFGPHDENTAALEPLRAATLNVMRAHAHAYHAIHAGDGVDADGDGRDATVTFGKNASRILPETDGDPADEAIKERLEYVFHEVVLNALVYGDVDYDFDGDYDGILNDYDPTTTDTAPTAAPEGHMPELAGTVDHLGITYFTTIYADASALQFPLSGGWFGFTPEGVPVGDNGAEIRPDGLEYMLDWYWRDYCLPIVITENSIDDDDDSDRPTFLIEHVEALQRAQASGVDVIAYLHWALLDHWELYTGYDTRQGLVEVDFSVPARTRTPRGSLDVYRQIIAADGVTDDVRAAHHRPYTQQAAGDSIGLLPFPLF